MLEVKNLSKRLADRLIINDLSFKVPDRQILAIVGPSGAGKTTLLRLISGLLQPDQGEIFLDGIKVNTSKPNAKVGVVFQEFNLFPNLKVLDNITLAPILVLKHDSKKAQQDAEVLLAKLSLRDQSQLYPYQLSGGQKQRVALARALAMKPEVICYDEPTSALDPDLRTKVAELIRQMQRQGLTQLVVTHDHVFAKEIADVILTINPERSQQ